MNNRNNGSTRVWGLVFVPAVITLAVTILRLVGELAHWSETFFRRSAGGAGALVGIVWLAFVFAIYFAVKLQNSGLAPATTGKAIALTVLALALFVGGEFLVAKGMHSYLALLVGGTVLVYIAIYIMRMGWPGYGNLLIAYALAARIPVVIIMYFAYRGSWGTHYDAVTPEFASTSLWTKFLLLAVVPQLSFWVAFTVIFCGLFGLIVVAVRKPKAAELPQGA
jgi:hypothetical protein